MQADLDAYNRITDQLHALEQAGREDSEEAEALRDQGDPLWYRLTEAEKDAARQHSIALG